MRASLKIAVDALDSGAGAGGKGETSLPSWFSKAEEERPQTPRVEVPSESDEARQRITSTVLLLQRLLRGRGAQNVMFQGKERRKALIKELRAADEAADEADEEYAETAAFDVKTAEVA